MKLGVEQFWKLSIVGSAYYMSRKSPLE